MKFLIVVHIGQLFGAFLFGIVFVSLCLQAPGIEKLDLSTVNILQMSLRELAQAEI